MTTEPLSDSTACWVAAGAGAAHVLNRKTANKHKLNVLIFFASMQILNTDKYYSNLMYFIIIDYYESTEITSTLTTET